MRTLVLLLVLTASGLAHAENCEINLKTGDEIKYDQPSVTVSSACKTITIRLTHTGKLPAQAMGHNVVISAADVYQAVAQDGLKAGLASNYMQAGETRGIAATRIIGGGETTNTMFAGSKLKAGGFYKFCCSFPGP